MELTLGCYELGRRTFCGREDFIISELGCFCYQLFRFMLLSAILNYTHVYVVNKKDKP